MMKKVGKTFYKYWMKFVHVLGEVNSDLKPFGCLPIQHETRQCLLEVYRE